MKQKLFTFLLAALLFPAMALADKTLNDLLVYHAYFGSAKQVKSVLEKGANPDTRDEHNWPVLAVVSDRNDPASLAIAKQLIDAGVDVNASHQHNYPLINAIRNKNVSLVYELLLAGANVFVRDGNGLSATQLAQKIGNSTIHSYVSKQVTELKQAQHYYRGQQHLKQVLYTYSFHHCAFQYWGFYLRSGQDRKVRDDKVIENRIQYHAREATKMGRRGLQYFPDSYHRYFDRVAGEQKERVFESLNQMVSNRQRRANNVGKITDMRQRCNDKTASDHFRYAMKDKRFY